MYYFLIFHYYIITNYTNLKSLITCCLSLGDMYLSFCTSISLLASSFCECLEDFFKTFVVLSAILSPVKSAVASTVFWIALLEAVFIASVVNFLHYQDVFDYIYYLNFYPCF